MIVPGDDIILNVTINEMDGEAYIPQDPEGMTMIHWIDTRQKIHYSIQANLDTEQLITLAENIFEKK